MKKNLGRSVLLAVKVSALSPFVVSCANNSESKVNSEYTFCHEGKSYKDQGHTVEDPNTEWVCGLPEVPNDQRCEKLQATVCAGGTLQGPHDVPTSVGAWAYATDKQGMEFKCLCGCFAPDTKIWVDSDDVKVATLSEAAKYQSVTVKVRMSLGDLASFEDSKQLRGIDFLNGLEEKPLVKIQSESGQSLTVTSKHPILLLQDGKEVLVQAQDLKTDDILVLRDGTKTKLKALSSVLAPKNAIRVYNFDTKAEKTIGHIISANGIQVGDNYLQNAIAELKHRVAVRKDATALPIDDLIKEIK